MNDSLWRVNNYWLQRLSDNEQYAYSYLKACIPNATINQLNIYIYIFIHLER